ADEFKEDENFKNIIKIYRGRCNLLCGEHLEDSIVLPPIENTDAVYKSHLYILHLYQKITELLTATDTKLNDLLSEFDNIPDTHILTAQFNLLNNSLETASGCASQAKRFLPQSAYVDFLSLQSAGEKLDDFQNISLLIKDFLQKYGPQKLNELLNSITISKKLNIPETEIFKLFIQYELKNIKDYEAAQKLISFYKLKCIEYKKISFISQLAAKLYESAGKTNSAAEEYYNAGIQYYNNNNFEQSEIHLRRAYTLNREHIRAGWYLSDSLYINSYIKAPPYADESKLRDAQELMDNCFKKLNTGGEQLPFDFSWVYLLKAYLHEQISNLKTSDTFAERRQAAAFIEFALITDANNITRLKTATRIYSNLAIDANAFLLAEKAYNINKNDKDVIEEFARVAINIGEFNKAALLLPLLYKLSTPDLEFYNGWKAFIEYMKSTDEPGLINSAIGLLANKLTKYDKDLWTHYLLLHCYWLTDDSAKAIEQADWIIAIETNDEYKEKYNEIAFAYFLKGNTDKALEINEIASSIPQYLPDAFFDATFYFIKKGKFREADAAFEKLTAAHLTKYQIKNYIRYYTELFGKSNREEWEGSDYINDLINNAEKGFIKRLNKKLEADNFSIDGINEIKSLFDTDENFQNDTWGRLALNTAMFRLHVQKKNYTQALFVFNEIIKDERSQFYLLTWEYAASFIKNSLKTIKDFSEAYSQTKKFEKDNLNHEGLTKVYIELENYINDSLGTQNRIEWALQVNPITVEMQKEIIPAKVLESNDISGWVFFTSYVPQLRQAIKKTYGIEPPGIRVRPLNDSIASHANGVFIYQFLLNEVPYVSGEIYSSYYYCYESSAEDLKNAGIEQGEIIVPPFTIRNKGAWVLQSNKDILKEKKINYWEDSLQCIIAHLEYVLVNNLSILLGVQQTESLLSEWRKNGFESLINELFREDAINRKIRFGKIIRALAEEKVPLINAEVILNYCLQSELQRDDIHDDLRNLRSGLQDFFIEKIKNNSGSTGALIANLEDEVASWTIKNNGKIFVQSPPENVQQWLSDFRDFVAKNSHAEIITVQNKQVRRFIKKIVELEYPQLEIIENFL
ncbi:MAG: FHIPEP family type III secretion protein, partial [Parafilimonas sp.]